MLKNGKDESKIKYLILEEPTVEDLCKMLLGKKVDLE